jgi:hypothetical protein
VILDPPTFAVGARRRGVKPWKALAGYPALVQAARRILAPGGSVFAASNTRELAAPGADGDRSPRVFAGLAGSAAVAARRQRVRVAAVLFIP